MSDVDSENSGALGLEGIFPEPPRPPTPEPSFSVHQRSREPTEVTIRLVGSHPLWAHHLWNAARVLADVLDERADEFCTGKKVLELGAGAGLPGIVCALNGADTVVLTDYPDAVLLDNLRQNVLANISHGQQASVIVEGHIWGTPLENVLPQGSRPFDVVILSDLIFNHSQHSAMLTTCGRAVVDNPTAIVLVFYTHHRPHLADRDMEFFRLAKSRGWDCEQLIAKKMEAMFPEDSGSAEVRSTVHGWRLRRPQNFPKSTYDIFGLLE